MQIKYDNSGEIPSGGIASFFKKEDEKTSINCFDDFIPYRLRSNQLFQRVNTLLCMHDGKFTDAAMRLYLTRSDSLTRAGLHSSYVDLDWFSQLTWEEAYRYDWEDAYGTGGEGNFKSRDAASRISNDTIWSNFAILNDEKFSKEGFTAWNNLIDPYVGTNLIQRKMLESLRLKGTVIDWYDDSTPVNTYSFVFDEFPGWDKTKALILASKTLKNAESYLTAVKDENCPHGLRLSHGFLDSDFVSDIYGDKFYGAYICFQRFDQELIEFFNDFDAKYLRIKYRNEQLNFWNEIFLSDNLYMDVRNFNRIFRTHTKLLPGTFVQMMPGYMKNIENKWIHGVTWEDQFTWEDINVTNTVYIEMEHIPMDWNYKNPVTNAPATWDTSNSWMGDVDESTWAYNKPCNGDACIVDRNFIPGFEPGSDKSLYRPLIHYTNTSTFDPDADILIARGGIVNYWDPDFVLGYMSLDGVNDKYVYTTHNRVAV